LPPVLTISRCQYDSEVQADPFGVVLRAVVALALGLIGIGL